MAISAQLQLKDDNSLLQTVSAFVGKTYDIVDMSFEIHRDYDITTCVKTSALGGIINVTIRGMKESSVPFHTWIKGTNKTKSGSIIIYDSATLGLSSLSSSLGSDDTITEKLEKEVTHIVDKSIDSGWEEEDDMFDDMDLKSLKAYITKRKTDCSSPNAQGLDKEKGIYKVEVRKTDTADELRNKIRKEEKRRNPNFDCKNSYQDTFDADIKNSVTKDAKSVVTKSASSVASTIMKKALDQARVISFKDAYCVKLRETFKSSDNNNGAWLIELGILAKKITVTGPGTSLAGIGAAIGNKLTGNDSECEFSF